MSVHWGGRGPGHTSRLLTQVSNVPDGYDIFVSAGQSNEFYGTGYDGTLDNSALNLTKVYQFPKATLTLSAAGARDPLAYPDTTNQSPANTYIGHAVHFLADATTGYNANYLLGARKAVIIPAAYGGTQVQNAGGNQWGIFGGATGTLSADLKTAADAALALTGTNSLKAILWTQGEGDYQAYGSTGQAGVVNRHRAYLLSVFEYFRANYPSVPIIMSRLSKYSIDAGQANYSYNGLAIDQALQSMPGVMPYLALVDSQSPSELGASGVHFTAAEQRTLATRFQSAYPVAVAATTTTTTWDAYQYPRTAYGYTAGCTLSNNNLDITGDTNSAWKTARASGPRTAGKLYFEIKAQAMASATNIGYVGICNAYMDQRIYYLGQTGSSLGTFYNGQTGKSAGFWGYTSGGQKDVLGYTSVNTPSITGTTALNDIYMFAVDLDSGKAWIGKNGTWQGDPAAGTGNWLSGVTGRTFIGCSIYTGTGNTWRLNAGASAFAYSVPSGFSAWKDGTP